VSLARIRSVLAGLWAGVLLCVGALAAPSLFAVLERPMAGLAAGRIFTAEAYWSLGLAVALLVLERALSRKSADLDGAGSQFTFNLGLVVVALACTVAGHFGIQPMIVQARSGQGAWSFAALHGASTALFAIKGLAVLVLAWRTAAS
jgi:hypothetical protein